MSGAKRGESDLPADIVIASEAKQSPGQQGDGLESLSYCCPPSAVRRLFTAIASSLRSSR